MKMKLHVLLVPLFALLISCPVNAQESIVKGRVTMKGDGVSGATIFMWRQPARSPSVKGMRRTRSDADGNFQMTVAPGSYYAWIAVPNTFVLVDGKSSLQLRSIALYPGEILSNLDFELARGGVITGRVTDPDDKPIAEAEVSLTAYPAGPIIFDEAPRDWATAFTDDRGVYRFFGVPEGDYKVSTRYPFRANQIQTIFYPSTLDATKARTVTAHSGLDANNIDLKMLPVGPRYSVAGRVVDSETGAPISQINIVLRSQSIEGAFGRGLGPTNDKGEFWIENVQAGRYLISTSMPFSNGATPLRDHYGQSTSFEVSDRDVSGIEIKANRNGRILGSVRFEGEITPAIQEELRGLRLMVSSLPRSAGPTSASLTGINPDGTFEVGGLSGGVVNFHPSPKSDNGPLLSIARVDHDGSPAPLEITAGANVSGVTVVLVEATGKVRGKIKLPPEFSGKRITGSVRVYSDSDRRILGWTRIDGQDSFLLENLPAGNVKVVLNLDLPGMNPASTHGEQTVKVTARATSDVIISLIPVASTPTP